MPPTGGAAGNTFRKQYRVARAADTSICAREDIVPGLETFPDTLLKLFRGENKGKLVLKVAEA